MVWKKVLGYLGLGAGAYVLHENLNKNPLYKTLTLAFAIPLAISAAIRPKATADIIISTATTTVRYTAEGTKRIYNFAKQELEESRRRSEEFQRQEIRIKTLEARLSATPTTVPTAIPQMQPKISRAFLSYPRCDNIVYCNKADLSVNVFGRDGNSTEMSFPCTMGSNMPSGSYDIHDVLIRGQIGNPLYAGNNQLFLDKDKRTEMLMVDDGKGFWTEGFILSRRYLPENNILLSKESMQELIARVLPNYQRTKVMIDG